MCWLKPLWLGVRKKWIAASDPQPVHKRRQQAMTYGFGPAWLSSRTSTRGSSGILVCMFAVFAATFVLEMTRSIHMKSFVAPGDILKPSPSLVATSAHGVNAATSQLSMRTQAAKRKGGPSLLPRRAEGASDRDAKVQAAQARADKSAQETREALARVQDLEAQLQMAESRAKSLQSVLSSIGITVGSALKNADVADGDLSLYDAAVKDSQDSISIIQQGKLDRDQTRERVALLENNLTVSESRIKALEEADQRAQKLSEGVKLIYEKVGAESRAGLFSSFFSRSEDDMIQDILEQIDEAKK